MKILFIIYILNIVFQINTDKPQISFSFDDPNTNSNILMDWNTRDSIIRSTLNKYNIQSILFVCGKRIDSDSGRELLQNWDNDGHLIANHTYSHYYYHSPRATFEIFAEDIIKVDSMIEDFDNFVKFFRFPYLKQGDTREKIDSIDNFLQDLGYRIGHVSIDASDWYIEQRLLDKFEKNPEVNIEDYKEFYLYHMLERANYYDRIATGITGRKIKHMILLHHNTVSALFLDDLINLFLDNGWEVISPLETYNDSIYSIKPDIIPLGESIVWALAKETGRYKLRYPAEDGVYEEDKMDSLGL